MQDGIKLLFHRVNKISFTYNEREVKGKEFKLLPKFECKMQKRGGNLITVLGMKVESTLDNPSPFDLEVDLVGVFGLGEYAPTDKVIQMKACLADLMPFLRATVASVTTDCNIPAYYIPYVDVNDMVRNMVSDSEIN